MPGSCWWRFVVELNGSVHHGNRAYELGNREIDERP